MKFYLPAVIWLITVTVLSTSPSVQLPSFQLLATDKLAHAGVYALLVLTLLWGRQRSLAHSLPIRFGWQAVLFATAYGALMEWVQYSLVPGRFCEFDDMLANAFGAVAGWAVWRIFRMSNIQ
jgi:VanZ family protein